MLYVVYHKVLSWGLNCVFADDTNIFCTGDDIYNLCNLVSQEIKKNQN